MGFYQFKRKQFVHTDIETLWHFISNPVNLKKITPDYMGFEITSETPEEEMYEGMIIVYQVTPLLGIRTTWVTEITKVERGKFFVDEQRMGPYKVWHHEHRIEKVEGGVMMTDIVSYQPPFGFLGSIANSLVIEKKLHEIFEYRKKVLEELF
ncbi:hypothetical protein DNU06_00450 [Putridiphycobacter roseus]|uniref:Coenzyme Q-binding protein COQ10 START domain-containing protein n=1 Tax=Putridiphycobacter roseus TaxID=2219161 RepID=A0A2W1N164_9FLAO|nr:SRPBCC family protein [Putridiphycobacter roseus]PZE18339.1 hypothetical protein DNU06_00450 [Putridiphycobacter roseus]